VNVVRTADTFQTWSLPVRPIKMPAGTDAQRNHIPGRNMISDHLLEAGMWKENRQQVHCLAGVPTRAPAIPP